MRVFLPKVGVLLLLVAVVVGLPLGSEEYDIEEYVIEIEEDYPDVPPPVNKRKVATEFRGPINNPQIGHRFESKVSTLPPEYVASIWGPASIDSAVIQQAIEEDNEIGLSWDEIAVLQNEFGRRLSPGRALVPLLSTNHQTWEKPAKTKPQTSSFRHITEPRVIRTTTLAPVLQPVETEVFPRTVGNLLPAPVIQRQPQRNVQSFAPSTTTTESPSTSAQSTQAFESNVDNLALGTETPHFPPVIHLDPIVPSSEATLVEHELLIQPQTLAPFVEEPTTSATFVSNVAPDNEITSTEAVSELAPASSTFASVVELTTPAPEPVASTTLRATVSPRRGLRLFSTTKPTPAAEPGTDAVTVANSVAADSAKTRRPNLVVRKRIRTSTEAPTTVATSADSSPSSSQPAVAESGNVDVIELPQANAFRRIGNRGRLTFKQTLTSTEASIQEVTDPSTEQPQPTTNTPLVTPGAQLLFTLRVPAGAQRIVLSTDDLLAAQPASSGVTPSAVLASDTPPATETVPLTTAPVELTTAQNTETSTEALTTKRNPFISRGRNFFTTSTTLSPVASSEASTQSAEPTTEVLTTIRNPFVRLQSANFFTTQSPEVKTTEAEVSVTSRNPLPGRRVNRLRPVSTTALPVSSTTEASRVRPTVRFVRGRRLNATQLLVSTSTIPSVEVTELPSSPSAESEPSSARPNAPVAGFISLPVTESSNTLDIVEVTTVVRSDAGNRAASGQEDIVAEEVIGTVIDSVTGPFGQRRRPVSEVVRS